MIISCPPTGGGKVAHGESADAETDDIYITAFVHRLLEICVVP